MLFVVAIPICIAIAATAAINAFYHPAHRMTPFNQYDIKASQFVMAASLVGTAAASIALALKFRTVASLLVVAIWSVILLGTQGARLLVQPGPEYFERRLGQEVYSVLGNMGLRAMGLPVRTLARLASQYSSAYPT